MRVTEGREVRVVKEACPLTQNPHPGPLTLGFPQSPPQGSECREEDVL